MLHLNEMQQKSRLECMNLVEWLRTPRHLRTRLEMETRPLGRLEMELVFLEVIGDSALLRFPVMCMFVPKGSALITRSRARSTQTNDGSPD